MQGNSHVEYWQIILTNMHFFREQPLRLQRGRLSDWSITQRRLGFAEQVVHHFLNPKKMELHKEDWVFQPFSNPKISQRNPKKSHRN